MVETTNKKPPHQVFTGLFSGEYEEELGEIDYNDLQLLAFAVEKSDIPEDGKVDLTKAMINAAVKYYQKKGEDVTEEIGDAIRALGTEKIVEIPEKEPADEDSEDYTRWLIGKSLGLVEEELIEE